MPFIVVGDWGRQGRHRQRAVARQMGDEAERIGSRFTATTGDNFYLFGVNSVNDGQWHHSFENVYTQAALRRWWFPALGNHDYYGNPQAQIDYSAGSDRWRMPRRYYKVAGADHGFPDADLFFLDTQPIVHSQRPGCAPEIARNIRGQDPVAQLGWLRSELRLSRAKWKLVLGHHPVYSYGPHGPTPELQRLRTIFCEHGVRAYICGHDHSLQHISRDGVDYICSGAGSALTRLEGLPTDGAWGESRSGFASILLSDEAMLLRFKYLDPLGIKVREAVIPRIAPTRCLSCIG